MMLELSLTIWIVVSYDGHGCRYTPGAYSQDDADDGQVDDDAPAGAGAGNGDGAAGAAGGDGGGDGGGAEAGHGC